MLSYRETISNHLKDLIAEGRTLSGGRRGAAATMFVQPDRYFRFRTQALNLVRRACGEDSDHYRQLRELVTKSTQSHYLPNILGVLEAAEHDFTCGLLFDMKALVRADLLNDLLEQAAYLLESGYKDPAAVLCGAVLENSMRKICDQRGIAANAKEKLDSMNAKLAKAGVYNVLSQKQVTVWADLRNKAAHGRYEEYKKEDVEEMLRGVRRFLSDHMS